jgi:hypothetical protein
MLCRCRQRKLKKVLRCPHQCPTPWFNTTKDTDNRNALEPIRPAVRGSVKFWPFSGNAGISNIADFQHNPRLDFKTMIQVSINADSPFTIVQGAEGVSATASAEGFTPVYSIAQSYGWKIPLREACTECNRRGEVAVINQVHPILFLVPRTHGKTTDEFLISDLIAAAENQRITKLHFSHFGFILGNLPEKEVRVVLTYLKSKVDTVHLHEVVMDVDPRVRDGFGKIYEEVFKRE